MSNQLLPTQRLQAPHDEQVWPLFQFIFCLLFVKTFGDDGVLLRTFQQLHRL